MLKMPIIAYHSEKNVNIVVFRTLPQPANFLIGWSETPIHPPTSLRQAARSFTFARRPIKAIVVD